MQKLFKYSSGLLVALICSTSSSQSNSDFQLVLLSETVLMAARTEATELLDGRYVLAEEKTLTRQKDGEARISSRLVYVFDCQTPKKVVLVSTYYNLETKPNAEPRWAGRTEEGFENSFNPTVLKYVPIADFNEARAKWIEPDATKRLPVLWPEGPTVVAEYACRVAANPADAKDIAKDLIKTGGILGLKELDCDLKWANGKESTTTVRFHDTLGFFQFNDIWKLKPFADDRLIGYSEPNGTTARINRMTGKFTMSSKDGTSYATGACEVARNLPRKF